MKQSIHNLSSTQNEPARTPKKHILLWCSLVTGGIILALIASVNVALIRPDTSFAHSLRRWLPLPVASLNVFHWVTFQTLEQERERVTRLVRETDLPAAWTDAYIETAVLNRLVEQLIIESLAQDRGYVVTPLLLEEEAPRVWRDLNPKSLPGESARPWENMDLDRRAFSASFVRPVLYREALEHAFQQESREAGEKARVRIQAAEKALREGETFETVAANFSDEASGDEARWIASEDLDPDLQTAVSHLKIDTVSPVVESRLGYHILLIETRRQDMEHPWIALRYIFVRKPDFTDWLAHAKQGMEIRVWSPKHVWNGAIGQVEEREKSANLPLSSVVTQP